MDVVSVAVVNIHSCNYVDVLFYILSKLHESLCPTKCKRSLQVCWSHEHKMPYKSRNRSFNECSSVFNIYTLTDIDPYQLSKSITTDYRLYQWPRGTRVFAMLWRIPLCPWIYAVFMYGNVFLSFFFFTTRFQGRIVYLGIVQGK